MSFVEAVQSYAAAVRGVDLRLDHCFRDHRCVALATSTPSSISPCVNDECWCDNECIVVIPSRRVLGCKDRAGIKCQSHIHLDSESHRRRRSSARAHPWPWTAASGHYDQSHQVVLHATYGIPRKYGSALHCHILGLLLDVVVVRGKNNCHL